MSQKYDDIIIGGGPGGYVVAIKLAQLGRKVLCIEGRKTLGGTCLNVGCIPSKTLLEFSEKYHSAKHLIESGIFTGELDCNFNKLMQKKEDIIKKLTDGIAYLFKKNKIDSKLGFAKFKDSKTVIVDGEEFTAQNFVIATGSVPTNLPNIKVDEKIVVTSTGALSLKEVPKKMIVFGAGVIGLEMASIFNRLGSEVEVIEFLPNITPSMDLEISKSFKKILEDQGVKFKMETKLLNVATKGDKAMVDIESVKSGDKTNLEADVVLIAIGRKPFTEGLGLENAGVQLNERGFVITNEKLQTNVSNIYAIGDVTTGLMLAHKASEEGIAVAETIVGKFGFVNYDVIPSIIYTHPEVASVGKTEEELKHAGIEYKIGKFAFAANSRAKAVDDTDGFVKVLVSKKTDQILGCHIIGRSAGDVIHEVVVAMEFFASSEDIARTCHAHPTLNEAVKEACLAAFSKPIHS
jgi:dihydrolipoamide dehydrogenase